MTAPRPWPRRLLAQTLLSTALVVVLAQALSLAMFYFLSLRPALLEVAQVTARGVAVLADALEYVPPAEQKTVLERVARASALEIWTGARPPDDRGPRPRPVERVFMREFARALDARTDIAWRTDRQRRLWIRTRLGQDSYWVSMRAYPSGAGLTLVSIMLGTTALALLASWMLHRRLLRPLHALYRATESYRPSAPVAPLPEAGPREVAVLARSFNRMTERLARADAERAMVLAGISHDLRTPLSKLKLALEMMRPDDPQLQDSAQRQVDGIERILAQFMTFARGFDAEPETLADPNALFEELAADHADHDIRVAPLQPPALLRCRPEALRRALGNLLENALRHGAGPVMLSADRTGGMLRLAVRDGGAGIPPALLPSVTEPFVRGDPARGAGTSGTGGTGLGLSIAEQVAQLHGGRLRLDNVAGGFCAALLLPGGRTSPMPAASPDP
ncbi:ATP-binding protein [uncultured Massilia sp.]|uniref:ATP-binding protein n=1 Tax=uncultured Massilia sp. TaxID=169973 RepID=UPI0025E74D11|nr:ATP-binding protein [uncultured Massilia sp.]